MATLMMIMISPRSSPRTKTAINQSNLWISRTPKPDSMEVWRGDITLTSQQHQHIVGGGMTSLHGSTNHLHHTDKQCGVGGALRGRRCHDDVITEAFIFYFSWSSSDVLQFILKVHISYWLLCIYTRLLHLHRDVLQSCTTQMHYRIHTLLHMYTCLL